jgi:beta-galactosidase
VTPFGEGKSRLPELTRLGAVQILVPAAPWQRHLFNGYAEVIVQAGTQPGDIRLTAHSENLESAMATVEAR